jgi:hypothetical protein
MDSTQGPLQSALAQAQANFQSSDPLAQAQSATLAPPVATAPPSPVMGLGSEAPGGIPLAPVPVASTNLSQNSGVSPSFNEQLGKNMDKVAAANPNPNAPGAWARNILGAVSSTLANADVGGTGAVAGMAKAAANARAAQIEKQKAAQSAAVAQSEIEKNHAETLDAQYRKYHTQHLDHMTERTQGITDGKNTVKLLTSGPEAADVLHENLTWPQAQTLIAQNKLDPTQNHVFPTGQVQTGEDEQGNPIYQNTYTVLGNLKDVHLDVAGGADFLKRWNETHPDQKLDATSIIPGPRFAAMEQSVTDIESATAARDLALKQAGINEADLDKKLEAVKLGPDWNTALASAGGDPREAEQLMLANPRTRLLYPNLHQDIVAAYGGETALNDVVKDMETKRHDIQDERTARIKANGEAAKNNPPGLEGDTTKTGSAYISTLPPGRQQLVAAIVSGKLNAVSPRVLSGKDGQLLMAEAYQADPNFDSNKVAGYTKVYNDFHAGKSADQIQAINVVIPHLAHLYDAVNAIPTSGLPFIGASDTVLHAEAASGNQPARALLDARTQATQELASAYAKGAVTDQEHKAFEKELETTSPQDLRNSVMEILDLLESKQHGLLTRWEEGAPSPSYKPPIQIVSPEAQGSMDRIYLMHDGKMTTDVIPPATVLGQLKPGYAVNLQNGQSWTRGEDGRPVLLNPAQ